MILDLCLLLAFAVLFVMLLVRASLNGLSAMALNRLAADTDKPSSSSVRAYLVRRQAYLLTLQVAILVTSLALAVLFTAYMFRSKADAPMAWGFLLSMAAVGVLIVASQVTASVNPQKVFVLTLPVLRLFVVVFGVLTLPLGSLLARRLAAARQRSGQDEEDKDPEIAALINVGRSEGILEGEDSVLIRGVLEFGDTVAREVMTPRTDMVCAPAVTPMTAGAELLAKTRHTRLPIYDGQIDNIVGVAYLKDFLAPLLSGEGDKPISEVARPVPFVPENKPISELLREFQQQKLQMAIVVDEYGGVDGLVTTEDLLEEIVGEIQEYDEAEDEPFREVEPGVVEALGRASVHDLAERLSADIPNGNYDSIAGWISTAMGAIPQPGHRLRLNGLDVQVVSADRRRIHKVRVARHPEDDAWDDASED